MGFDIRNDENSPAELIAKRKVGKGVGTVYIGTSTASYFVGEEGKLLDVSFRKMARFIKKLPV